VIADLPTWVDVHFLRDVSGTVVVVAILVAVVLMFVIRSLATKVIVVLLVAVAVFTLVHYRDTLERCGNDGCSCVLFGQPVHNDNCPDN
jgi:hypothetical protein